MRPIPLAIVAVIWLYVYLPGNAEGTEIADIAVRIDRHIDAKLAEQGVEAAQPADDVAFIRRVTLDLAGRIPSLAERDWFLQSTDVDRRERLVQRLLDSPDFAYHQRNQLDILLLLRLEHNDKWREYLLEATRENRSWDQLFREVILPEETMSDDLRPVSFLKRRINDLDAMTNDTSVVWFGVNIACAKCHDHPLVDDWKQEHYFGMSAFFKRTFRTKKGFLSERFDGTAKYTDLSGKQHEADFMFLTGARVQAPELKVQGEELQALQKKIQDSEKNEKAEAPPRPDFRPRAEFVELALTDHDQRFFARNIVNRIWARLFGRGLVHPLDQMHPANQASHPVLLNELADEMQQSGYDLRRIIHAIVLTKAYARSSRYETSDTATSSGKPSPELFACAVPRPLSPRQYSLSLRIAATNPEKITGLAESADGQSGVQSGVQNGVQSGVQSEDWAVKRERFERQADGLARRLPIPDDEFHVSATESLWFSNNQSVENDFLNGSGDRVVGFLKQSESNQQAAELAISSVLSRPATGEEIQAIAEYLDKRADRREQGLKQVVWALICSSEFRFNH